MAYDLAKVTANGNNLIAQILANKSSLSIDKIEISDTQLSSTTDISTMTSVPKVVQTVSANGFSKNSNTLIISTVVDNSSISADYKAWVFGIWGSDSQNGQSQLIAVITSTNSPDTIPAFSGRTPVSYTYKFNIGFSNASQIKFNMINDLFATNDTVVHTTGDETVDGKKTFKVDPVDKNGDAYITGKGIPKNIATLDDVAKKVNVADMRKPASDVAGIEEVSAKQDKIGYTPADATKVVYKTDAPSSIIRSYLTSGTDLNTVTNPGIFPFNQCTFVNDINSVVKWGAIVNNVLPNQAIMQEIILGNSQVYGYRIYNSGINSWSSWLIPADDSKVAHLSGANNFDTVPTVNNNPLLLASSLPSDLARTGSDQEFTGKNTFDTAPIDKTTGNPYITKDGVPAVPSTLADTTKLANFTDGLQSGGKDVATTDQLPVVSDTGWVDAQISFPKSDGDWLKQRVKNGVLYIMGNVHIVGSTTNLSIYQAIKIDRSWKLPPATNEAYYRSMKTSIASVTTNDESVARSWAVFNNTASVSNGYLLTFASANGNSSDLPLNLAIPID